MPNRPELQPVSDPDIKVFRHGISRQIRAAKKAEAEERNLRTHPDKRRAHWRALGFSRESVAAHFVRKAVAEGTVISKTIIPDM